jgi:hypothetical protein
MKRFILIILFILCLLIISFHHINLRKRWNIVPNQSHIIASLSAPTNLTVTRNGNILRLSWDNSNTTQDGFTIQYSMDAVNNWTQLANITSTSLNDTHSANTKRFYRVRAYRNSDSAVSAFSILNGGYTGFNQPSNFLTNATFDWADSVSASPGSDLWKFAWSGDDNVYTSWGDGGGFHGDNSKGRVALGVGVIKGTPFEVNGYNINGGWNVPNRVSTWSRAGSGKNSDLISINGTLWGIFYDQRTPVKNHIMWSKDKGVTWTVENSWTFTTKLYTACFVKYGKDYNDNADGYVYIIGIGSTTPSISNIKLLRANKDSLVYQTAWFYYAGLSGGSPIWTHRFNSAQNIFVDSLAKSSGGFYDVVWISPLNRFIATEYHGNLSGGDADMQSIALFEASSLWGTWKTIYTTSSFKKAASTIGAVSLQIGYKNTWMASDGLAFTLVFSGDHEYDKYMSVPVYLTCTDTSNVRVPFLPHVAGVGADTIRITTYEPGVDSVYIYGDSTATPTTLIHVSPSSRTTFSLALVSAYEQKQYYVRTKNKKGLTLSNYSAIGQDTVQPKESVQ